MFTACSKTPSVPTEADALGVINQRVNSSGVTVTSLDFHGAQTFNV
jgi:hypothetical protein